LRGEELNSYIDKGERMSRTFKKNGIGLWFSAVIVMIFFAGAFISAGISGCVSSQTAVPTSGGTTPTAPTTSTSTTSTPTVSEIANDATQWIQGAEKVVGGLCQNGIMGKTDCDDASLASNLANIALATFQKSPTADNQAALSATMKPVYATAIKANTTATALPPAAAATVVTPLPGAAEPAISTGPGQ
jgi:hypothetical protein